MEQSNPFNLRQRKSYVVWEITLKCNLLCNHCGSRAGDARSDELDTAEAIDLIHQMAAAGISDVTLIGGEAYLRKDWLQLVAEITKVGMVCSMVTGGYGISAKSAKRMKKAGLASVSVSLDGMRLAHDQQRGKIGSWDQAFQSLEHLSNAGIPITANSQVNRVSFKDFPKLYQKLVEVGVNAWQIAITVPMGNAADNNALLLQPKELQVVHPVLAHLLKRGRKDGLSLQIGNNMGYYGPYEKLMRSYSGTENEEWGFWRGCNAGLATLGIEADGAIKGCPSLPTTAYTGGNIREHSLVNIVSQSDELNINMNAGTPEGTQHLWGFCKSCEYAELCRGGCTWTAHVFFDKRGNNPYCYHRSLVQAAQGKQEQIKLIRKADGIPFDNGEFALNIVDLAKMLPNKLKEVSLENIKFPKQWLEKDSALISSLQEEMANNIKMMQDRLALL
ncbi:MAG: radical SAM protein [Thiotrichaceae bacterium]|nr:radical SAM protein [Thiotrichaceae bacterium]